MNLFDDFLSLIFPNLCACCGNSLFKHEKIICTLCDFRLPRTNFHLERNNDVSRSFWGRVPIESAASFFYFHKGSRVQQLIHLLKYKERKEVGVFLGEKYGTYLKHSPFFSSVEVIIPVPLHKKKRLKRGYNQSEEFAKGLASKMKIPLNCTSLVRTMATATQTRKSRYRRWENVSDMFVVLSPELVRGKHILLVDDVITTGATLEACAVELLKIEGVRISIASIAYSNR